jgi:uncharacterized protein YjbI with pentapeptide repeats
MNKEENISNKCPICGRPTHKESKYCIFHASAEEKTEEEFKKALKEYVKKIKKEDSDYDFIKFIFVGSIIFSRDLNITIFKNADFILTTFMGDADFLSATFKGNADFTRATFKGNAYFSEATIEGNAVFEGAIFNGSNSFKMATFKGYTNFRDATLKRYANFWMATFKGNAFFGKATFKGNANFWMVTFEREADFSEATFKGDIGFGRVTFGGDVDFRVKSFVKGVTLTKIRVLSGKKLNLKVRNNIEIISLERAYLENIYLDIELVEGILIDFTDASLKNTKIKKGQIENRVLQEKKKKFSEAQEIYLVLKNNFHTIGQYEDESWAYKKEKDMERLSQSFPYYKVTLKKENKKESFPIIKWIQKGNFKKWITSAFSNMIYGYGERPWNVVKTALAIIIIFALSFSFIGLGNPEIIELKGTAIHQNSENIVDLVSKGLLKNNVIRYFPDSLYFSTITFTTLGYGDFRPLEGWGRILAGSEAFIGAFMMALFVYTFARRTGGR